MAKQMFASFILALVLTTLPGCGAELALVGVAGKGAATVMGRGKLFAAETSSYPRVINATRMTIRDLQFRVVGVRDKGEGRWDAHVRDERGALITFRVTRRTPKLCQLRVDVGWFGSEAVAHVIYERIEFYLERWQKSHPERRVRVLKDRPRLTVSEPPAEGPSQ